MKDSVDFGPFCEPLSLLGHSVSPLVTIMLEDAIMAMNCTGPKP